MNLIIFLIVKLPTYLHNLCKTLLYFLFINFVTFQILLLFEIYANLSSKDYFAKLLSLTLLVSHNYIVITNQLLFLTFLTKQNPISNVLSINVHIWLDGVYSSSHAMFFIFRLYNK